MESEPTTLYRVVPATGVATVPHGSVLVRPTGMLEDDQWFVPVEPDPAMLPEDSANECAIETVLKGGTNHCIRPDGHKGMHLAFTYWGAGIGDNDE